VAAGIIVDHNLSRFEDRPQTPLSRCLEEGSRARALEHERGNKSLMVERIDETHPLCAIARLLPPARFASRTPATMAGSMVIHAGLGKEHTGGDTSLVDIQPAAIRIDNVHGSLLLAVRSWTPKVRRVSLACSPL
jgi:hypothetical protein